MDDKPLNIEELAERLRAAYHSQHPYSYTRWIAALEQEKEKWRLVAHKAYELLIGQSEEQNE